MNTREKLLEYEEKIDNYSNRIKDFSIEGAVVPGLLLLEQSKSPGTTAPSIETSLHRIF